VREQAGKPKNGDLRVWWIPQVPMEPFRYHVSSVQEAAVLLDALAKYDLFQFENKVKPGYCNAGGLERYNEERGWTEFEQDGINIYDCIEPRSSRRFDRRAS
jgi:hypothetical protein